MGQTTLVSGVIFGRNRHEALSVGYSTAAPVKFCTRQSLFPGATHATIIELFTE